MMTLAVVNSFPDAVSTQPTNRRCPPPIENPLEDIANSQDYEAARQAYNEDCPKCAGDGSIDNCFVCDNSGYRMKKRARRNLKKRLDRYEKTCPTRVPVTVLG